MAVDVGADVFGVLALLQVRDAAGEFDHFDAARDGPYRVGHGLAVFFAG